MLRKNAERYLKQIGAMSKANVPDDEQVSLHSSSRMSAGPWAAGRAGDMPVLSLNGKNADNR
jgi:hypothetical protein